MGSKFNNRDLMGFEKNSKTYLLNHNNFNEKILSDTTNFNNSPLRD
jgi:hypothetical protein